MIKNKIMRSRLNRNAKDSTSFSEKLEIKISDKFGISQENTLQNGRKHPKSGKGL